jgi:hypothetical protein
LGERSGLPIFRANSSAGTHQMATTVFFSWQADRPKKEGRNFIERALDQAVADIGGDTTLEAVVREVVVDRDTKNVPGFPPIVETIFRKIDQAAVFVPDFTFVAQRENSRLSPNPNVLIEYGWALKSLGHSHIVPVMNTAFGAPAAETLPFNIRHLRHPITYDCPPDADQQTRKKVRTQLARDLERAIRGVLTSDEFLEGIPPPPSPPVFSPRMPEEGLGRFRAWGSSIGIASGGHIGQQADVRLPAGPIIWLRLMPTFEPSRKWSVMELTKSVWDQGPIIDPLCYTIGDGLYKVRGDDGFGVYSPFRSDTFEAGALSFVFTTGEIWGINLYWLPRTVANEHKYIPNVESLIVNNLRSYGALLGRLGVSPPYAWTAGMEDTKGRILYSRGRYQFPGTGPRCAAPEIVASGTYSPPDDPIPALKPFFTALFDACGQEWDGPYHED